ncbi:hypothetical protein E4U58_005763 [Claviceps cyperi]|nr:hypothetical protein E4U58_005763 [Claviceps cyperi]
MHASFSISASMVDENRDPLCLPAEVVTQIFSYLKCDEMLYCLRVSKQWTCTLTSPMYAPLWRDMTFSDGETNCGPSTEELRKMLSWAGDGGARKIVIPRRMMLTGSKLTLLLEASPSLEYLEFLDLPKDLLFPSNGKAWNQLTYFSLKVCDGGRLFGPRGDGPGRFPHSFLQNAAISLEHLDLVGIPAQWYYGAPLIPLLPSLKILRISQNKGMMDAVPFPFPLSIAFPNLEQLSIGPDVPHLDPAPLSIWRERRRDIWPHLKVLIFEFRSSVSSIQHVAKTRLMLRYLMCLSRGNSLQHIRLQLRIDSWNDIFSIPDTLIPDFDDVQELNFQNLRFFSSTFFCLPPNGARTLLSNSVQTKRLTSFDIVFLKHTDAGRASLGDLSHLRSYEWARGAPSIQALGFYRFRFWCYPEECEYHPLAEFVATFPNLRTLSIWSPYYGLPELARLVGMILRVTHLETIYMLFVGDEAFAQLRQAALDQGVRLMEISEPRQWPVPLGA